MGAERQDVGAWRTDGRWEKNSLGRKLTLYGGRWETVGGMWERVPPVHPSIILYVFLGCRKTP